MKGYRRRYCPTSVPSRCSWHRYITALNQSNPPASASAVNPSAISAGDTSAGSRQLDGLRVDIADGKQLAFDHGKNTFFPLHPCSGARDIGQGQQRSRSPASPLSPLSPLLIAPHAYQSMPRTAERSFPCRRAKPAVSPVAAFNLKSVASSPNRA